jgi:uncharacterized lipoprotein
MNGDFIFQKKKGRGKLTTLWAETADKREDATLRAKDRVDGGF